MWYDNTIPALTDKHGIFCPCEPADPKEVLDYVVVHELAHIKEMNHSKAFWKEVEKVLPDYEERRKWLKEHGSELTKEEAVRQIYRDN